LASWYLWGRLVGAVKAVTRYLLRSFELAVCWDICGLRLIFWIEDFVGISLIRDRSSSNWELPRLVVNDEFSQALGGPDFDG